MLKVKSFFLFLCLILGFQSFGQIATDSTNTDSTTTDKKYFAQLPATEPEKTSEDFMKEAIVHFDGERYNKSIECLNTAIEINEFPQLTAILYFYRAVSKSKMNNYTEAINDYTKAISENPRKSKYIYHRGLAYFKTGAYEDARKDFETTLSMDGANADIYVKLGFLKQQDNELKAAIQDYSKAIELNPKFATPYYYRGLIYLQVLMPENACEDLQKAMQLGHPTAYRQYEKYCDK